MAFRRLAAATLFLCLVSVGLSSCLARRRLISRKGASTSQSLLSATLPDLLSTIEREYNAIHDFTATVDMVPALGTTEKSKITEYKDVRAYIVFRKPSDIRIIGLFPLVRNTAFDMVSNGLEFKLYVPSKNRFLVGANEVQQPSANKLENLRPQHFLDALIVRPVDPAKERVLLENFTDEDNAFYILHIVHETAPGKLELVRTVWVSRLDLKIARQMILDPSGNILTDARYSDWKTYDNIAFPRHVEINRPRDEYNVVIDVVKMDINSGVSTEKFALTQPSGTTLQHVGDGPSNAGDGQQEAPSHQVQPVANPSASVHSVPKSPASPPPKESTRKQ
jgi:hypothetical protein